MPEGPSYTNGGGGLTIFKGNSDLTQFKRIKYDSDSGILKEVPCQ